MRIVMDLQGAQSESRYRGIGRYATSLAVAAARRCRQHELHIALNGAFPDTLPAIRSLFDGLIPRDRIHVFHLPMPVAGFDSGNDSRRSQAELIREAALCALEPDVLHVSSLFEGYSDNSVTSVGVAGKIPTVVTLYDLIPLINPEFYLEPDLRYREAYTKKIEYLRSADALVAISESSATEARDLLGFDAQSIFNISAGCDAVFRQIGKEDPLRRSVRDKFGLRGDFVLYTGGSDDRKNLARLIEAYSGLPPALRKSMRLVLAGRMHAPHVEVLRNLVDSSELEQSDVVFTGYVTDQELVGLYSECKLFVFPSWHEGFGLPVLEAMACGAAVLASDASSIREIVNNESALFDPFDVSSIQERMRHFLVDDEGAQGLRAYSLERARAFSWNGVADRFLDACEALNARSLPRVESGDCMQAAVRKLGVSLCVDVQERLAVADSLDKSVAPAKRQIMIDVSELAAHDHKTGIQRVTRAIVCEWERRAPGSYKIQLVRLDRDSRRYVCANEYSAILLGHAPCEDSPLVCHAGDVFLGLDLVGDCVSYTPAWFDYLRATGVTVAFVIYDILPIRYPEWWPGNGGLFHERWLRDVVNVSDRLVCISHAVAEDVRDWIRECSIDRHVSIGWFHLGADLGGSSPSRGIPEYASVILERLAKSPSFLMVGTLEPRKGHAQVLAAFETLWAEGSDAVLVVVGKRGWMVDALCEELASHPRLNRELFWLQGASDEFLERLYSVCSCLIAASEGEGFGLPLIEAAQRELPIIARDLPVFREVAGDYAFYFSACDRSGIARAIRDWMELYAAGRHPRPNGMPWLTWAQSAEQLAGVLLSSDSAVAAQQLGSGQAMIHPCGTTQTMSD